MRIQWEKCSTAGYPYYIPKCKDNRVDLYQEFLHDFKIERIANTHDIGKMGRFLDGDRTYNNTGKEIICDIPPFNDHDRIFKGEYGSLYYVFHPYSIDLDILEEWCNERDIIYCFCKPDKSFYYPEQSYMVILMSDLTWEFATYSGSIMKWEYEGTQRKFEWRTNNEKLR